MAKTIKISCKCSDSLPIDQLKTIDEESFNKLKASILKYGFSIDYCVGSGTSIIASEQTGRRCYAMEIDPHYCDVAVKRWEDFTGEKATLQT